MAEIAKGALIEMGIEPSWFLDDTPKFIEACVSACRELGKQLDASGSQADIVEKFRDKSRSNKDAVEQANDIYDQLVSLISDLDPEVVSNLIPKLTELTQYANNIVTTSAMRESGIKHVSKKIVHAQYKAIKEGYEDALSLLKAFFPDKLAQYKRGNDYVFPTIPPKQGNYRDNSGHKLYSFVIDGETYYQPFKVAKMLGFEHKVKTYMDVFEEIKKNPGKYPNVTLVEI